MRLPVIPGLAVAATVGTGALLMGADPPAYPQRIPPLPVPPVERRNMPPFYARVTISGDGPMRGVFETCMDPAANSARIEARAKARPAGAPPVTGCTSSHEAQPGGAMRLEMSCDRAKGAPTSSHVITTLAGTPGDVRAHSEITVLDPKTGAAKTTITDRRIERLGACPADLKPGQMRRPGGPAMDASQAGSLLDPAAAPRT